MKRPLPRKRDFLGEATMQSDHHPWVISSKAGPSNLLRPPPPPSNQQKINRLTSAALSLLVRPAPKAKAALCREKAALKGARERPDARYAPRATYLLISAQTVELEVRFSRVKKREASKKEAGLEFNENYTTIWKQAPWTASFSALPHRRRYCLDDVR